MKNLLRLMVVLGLAIAIVGCAGTTPRLAGTESPDARALQQEGKALENDSNYEAAADKYRKAIKLGSAEASYDLGLLYYSESIPSKDEKEAQARCFKLLEQAADAGYAPAQYELGYMYLAGTATKEDPEKGLALVKQAAEGNYVDAQMRLAHSYWGQASDEHQYLWPGLAVNMDEAIAWFKRAVNNGSAPAAFYLGYIYASGKEVPLNYAEAAKWYEKAINSNLDGAENNLGNLYVWGLGVPRDYAKAKELYQKAIDMGSNVAQYNTYEIQLYAPKPYGNKREAVREIRKIAEGGYTYAQCTMGDIYANGLGVTRNYAEAAKWYEKASSDNEEAMYYLGELYRQGLGVKRDYFKAVELYQRSSAAGNPQAERALGRAYFLGQGVDQDKARGMMLYESAAKHGDQEALYLLGREYESGEAAERDSAKARDYYQAAADYTVQQFPYTRYYDPAPIASKARAALNRMK